MKISPLTILLLIILFWLFTPKTVWREAQRLWAQRDLMLRTLVVIIIVYFVYGIYELHQRGWFSP